MTSPTRKPVTLRITQELDQRLTEKSRQMGVSKNAYILMVLAKSADLNDVSESARKAVASTG